MFVEDALALLARRARLPSDPLCGPGVMDAWSRKFLIDVDARVSNGQPMSTAQARVFLRLLGHVRVGLVAEGSVSDATISLMLARPRYRTEPYQSINMPREVRHLGDNLLAFRFKMAPEVIKDIKEVAAGSRLGHFFAQPRFDAEHKVWIVPVTRDTVDAIQHIITTHRFAFDEETLIYLHTVINTEEGAPVSFRIEGDQIIGDIPGNDIVAMWATHVLRGEVV